MSSAAALTIGHFDGVHRGHAALVRAGRVAADAAGGRVIALTFDPHPAAVLRPGTEPPRLSRFDDRRQWLLDAGADEVVRLEPTPGLLSRSPEEFLQELVEAYRPAAIVEGPDFRFGRGRSGSLDSMRRFSERLGARGFRVIEVPTLESALADHSLVRISSSMIRWLLQRGRVDDARRLLGRPYDLRGGVMPGDRRGREMGFPTANIDAGDLLLPADGIYAGAARLPDGRTFPAAISIGTKPTFGARPRAFEAHLPGYDGPVDEYHWSIAIAFHHWLRDQMRFDDAESLRAQISRDVARVQALAGSAPVEIEPVARPRHRPRTAETRGAA
jgi:riboflavin kinase/FMN adenylyltransferase